MSRRGATVRTRRQLLNVPADLNRPRTPRDAIAASLTAPLLMSALPLRIATFALRGPEQSKVQLLIRADVGNDYTAARRAWVGYVIQDRAGRVHREPSGRPDGDCSGDERRAGCAAVFGRRQPRSGRVHHQARGGRRRSDRQRRAPRARDAGRSRRGLAERADGRRTDRTAARSCVRPSATRSASAPCTDISRPTARTWSRWPRSTRSRRPPTARR